MAFRALLFTKHPETNAALTAACKSAGILLEIYEDIFTAIEKGTKQQFSCVLADWTCQPESGFLVKRARESACNASTVAIGIVEHEPGAAEMSHHRLDFLIYRPITTQEANEVLTKALERMPSVPAAKLSETMSGSAPAARDLDEAEDTADSASGAPTSKASKTTTSKATQKIGPKIASNQEQVFAADPNIDRNIDPYFDPNFDQTYDPNTDPSADEGSRRGAGRGETLGARLSEILSWHLAAALILAMVAGYCVWQVRDTMIYLARTRENRTEIFRESVAAFFSLTPPVPSSSGATGANVPLDAYVAQASGNSEAPVELKVIRPQAEVSNAGIELRRREDLPLAAPVNAAPAPAGPRPVPESLRGASPITSPTVVTVSPAQMLPVSIPVPSPASGDQVSEPVAVSEEAERALLVSTVAPVYPPEAASQKAQGPVVLQATIGRDGTVEDLKIVRGSFVLSKAAIAAVKQWRFQPYRLNGHPAQTQTLLTINFSGPA